jgi:hypothetical protein
MDIETSHGERESRADRSPPPRTVATAPQAWQPPAFFEIKMDAEIGSYQEDGDRRGNVP